MGQIEKIFGGFTYYLLSLGVTILQCDLSQLRTKSKTRPIIARCKFIERTVGRKFL